MLSRRQFIVLLGSTGAVAAAGVAGVSLLGGTEAGDGLPVIRYGQESCVHCGMIIDDPRFAAARTDRGERHFDDIGCLAEDLVAFPAEAEDADLFVHDYGTEAWLAACDATYVRSTELRTPMASGVAAFAVREDANRASVDLNGDLFAFPSLTSFCVTGGHA
jgi:copper chaperone NosL